MIGLRGSGLISVGLTRAARPCKRAAALAGNGAKAVEAALVVTMILSLIAPAGRLDPRTVAAIAGRGPLGAVVWLAEAEACDVEITGAIEGARRIAGAAFAGAPIDINVVPAAGRAKRLLVADMESTLIENEMIDELAETVGIGEAVREITWRAMNGELDFRDALRERVVLLAGLPIDRLEAVAASIRLMPGAPTL
ncbi:MAG: hypothetical protein FJX57_23485, partial [Alphaproteobacteria bacterium]|nr:hypothetical protein [Alphaproteobacteria bacterium]